MTNILDGMYNAAGYTLSWGHGQKTLTTGVSVFAFHLHPLSSRAQPTRYGAEVTHQAECDLGLNIRPGDFLFVTSMRGSGISPKRFRVDGVVDYPHMLGLLDHSNLFLSEYNEN